MRSKLKKRKANDDDDDDETKRKEKSAMRLVNNYSLFIDSTLKI